MSMRTGTGGDTHVCRSLLAWGVCGRHIWKKLHFWLIFHGFCIFCNVYLLLVYFELTVLYWGDNYYEPKLEIALTLGCVWLLCVLRIFPAPARRARAGLYIRKNATNRGVPPGSPGVVPVYGRPPPRLRLHLIDVRTVGPGGYVHGTRAPDVGR